MSHKITSFLDIIIYLVKNKWFIIIFTLIMSIFAVAYSMLTKEKWTSEFTVVPLIDTSATITQSSILDGLGFGSGTSLKTLTLKFTAVMGSRTTTEDVIRKFDLIKYYNITEPDSLKAIDFAKKKFHTNTFSIVFNEEVYFITVRITTYDKYFSTRISQHYLDFLIDYTLNNSNNVARQRRELLESRVDSITSEMMRLAEELREFHNEHNIVEIEGQSLAIIESYGVLLQEFLNVDIELNQVATLMPNSIKHRDLTEKRRILLDTIGRLETGYEAMPFLLSLNNLANQAFTVQEKSFILELYRRILLELHPRLEHARIEEINSIDRLEIIDLPSIPGVRSHPRRALICITTFMLSFLFASGCVIMKEILNEEDKEKIKEIWKALFR